MSFDVRGRFLFTEETGADELHEQMALPFFATFYAIKAFLPAMLETGNAGIIVNIDSPASLFTWPGAIGYNSARFALRGMSESLRQELRGTSVGVLSVFPGKVESNYDIANVGADLRVPKLDRLTPTLTAEEMGRKIAVAIKRNKRALYAPFAIRVTAAQARLFPRFTSWLMAVTGARRAEIDPGEVDRGALVSTRRGQDGPTVTVIQQEENPGR